MTTERLFWFLALAAFPGTVLCAYTLNYRGRRLYSLAAACAGLLVAFSAIPLALSLSAQTPVAVIGRNSLPIVLVPFAALLWLITVVVTPSGRRNEAGLARSATACLLHMTAFLTVSPTMLVLIWVATAGLFVSGNSEASFGRARRVAISYLGLSTLLLAAGVALSGWARSNGTVIDQCGIGLILLAVMVRKGIFPFHAWIPEIFGTGRIGPAARFNAPQIATYAVVILAVPRANHALLEGLAALALVTAVYGSVMALHQTDARRACGYLFVSQSALVIAGLELPNPEALVGALILWVCSGVALAGLSRAVLALEARRGRLQLNVYHGGYEMMPQLAICFLIMGLSIANFPGTLGFVGGEMLVRGAVDFFPVLGLFAVIATALNGLAAMRMYFSLFCGKKASGVRLGLRRGEVLGFAAAAFVLLGFGLAPAGLARTLARASAAALQSRPMVGR